MMNNLTTQKEIQLYDYQETYLKSLDKNHKGWIIDSAIGSGKTIMALFWYQNYNAETLIIIAPAAKVKEQGWQRTCVLFNIATKNYKIVSYNSMHKISKQEYSNAFVIFDEVHRVKVSTGVWGRRAWAISLMCKHWLGLSGTPHAEGWLDCINYFKMSGLVKSKAEFVRKYCDAVPEFWGGMSYMVSKDKEDEVKELWSRVSSYRINKEDCNELPELVYKDLYAEKSKEYNSILKTRIYNDEPLDSNMALRHCLRSFCSTNKLQIVQELLDSTDENIVIFYNYDSELEVLKTLTCKSIYECNGHAKTAPSVDYKGKNTVVLANYLSGSEAVEFTYATVVIYYSPSESWTNWHQSIGRCHRQGQTNKVTAYKLITKNTIEEDIYWSLENKEDFNFDLWYDNKKKGN